NIQIKLFFQQNKIKLGGPGVIDHCDETMLNHKVKAHRSRAPKSKYGQMLWLMPLQGLQKDMYRLYLTEKQNLYGNN
ncbi:hypothetical protein M153_267930003, partial [Pseudoloma neurophilia]